MEIKPLNEELIVRYLLGELPESEQALLEERAFSDRQFTEDILAVESDLIDEYVRGGLAGVERQRFEQHFLNSAERRRKVEFARALAQIAPVPAAAAQPARIHWLDAFAAFLRSLNPGLRFSMAALSLLLLTGVSWLFAENIRLRRLAAGFQAEQKLQQQQLETLRQQATNEHARSEDLAAQLERERANSEELARQIERAQTRDTVTGDAIIASLFLPPDGGRGETKRPELIISSSARLARLQIGLQPEDQFNSFRAELRTAQGRQVWTHDHLRPQQSRAGRVINLTFPSTTLSPGRYELTLKGVADSQKTEDLRYYYFDVSKR